MKMFNRRVPKLATLPLLTVLAIPALAAGPAGDEASWDKPDKKWRSGPVKYLLTKDEDKEYKGLETDEARAKFVQSFWERRDPSPGTPANEYRDAFYTNAREATARFAEEGGKGWQDDRGKIYILLGPPDDMSDQEGLIGDSGVQLPTSAGGYGSAPDSTVATQGQSRTVKFIYLTNPLGPPGRLELTFNSDVTGGFRLQDRLDWDTPILRGLASPTKTAAAPASTLPQGAAPGMPATPAAPPAPPAPPPVAATPQSELMEQVRAATAGSANVPLGLNLNYYMARDASTSATLTLEVPADAIPAGTDPNSLIVAAEFLDATTGESAQRFFNHDQFGFLETSAQQGKKLIFQSQRSFAPGRYKAIIAVKDPASGSLGAIEKEVDVPGFSGDALGLSTVTLVHKLERLATPPASEAPQPFILGSFKVVPRSSASFLHGEEMIFYYQVYGAANDAATGKPKLDITYAFEMKQQDTWKMIGRDPVKFQGQQAPVQAYGLPINPRFPSGDYRVRIEVADVVAGNKTTAEIPFTVNAPEKTSQAK